MGKKILTLLSFMLLLSPNLASADCADLSNYTDWVREDKHTIVFYTGNIPLARLTIPYCEVLPSSTIRLTKFYVCDSDEIIIDNKACSLMKVKVLY
jgi:hypothetical protein